MNRKHIFAASAIAFGIALSGPALANHDNGGIEFEQEQDQDQGQAQGQDQGQAQGQAQSTDVDSEQQQSNSQNLAVILDNDYAVDVDVNEDYVIANQELSATNVNFLMEEVVDIDDEYDSGSNSANDNAFQNFAGMLNLAWNTGINANTQAANNVAARGTVSIGN